MPGAVGFVIATSGKLGPTSRSSPAAIAADVKQCAQGYLGWSSLASGLILGRRCVMVKTAIAAILVVLVGIVPPAHGWDHFGHMMVAYVAYQDLTQHTKSRANALVRKNPNYTTWLK